MFVLRHVSRNAARKPSLQYISTTSIRYDESNKKDPPLHSDGNDADQKTEQPSSKKLSETQLNAREKLKFLFKESKPVKDVEESQDEEVKVDVNQIKEEYSKGRERFYNFIREPKKVQKLGEKVPKEEIIDLTDNFKDEIDAAKNEKHLQGKQKLEELMRLAETSEVNEKVNLSRPPGKRPVDKIIPKAETKAHLDLLKSIRNVADQIGGDVKKVEEELLEAVFETRASEESEKKRTSEPKSSIGEVISDMTVDTTKTGPRVNFRGLYEVHEQVKHQRRKFIQRDDSEGEEILNLFDNNPLRIFDEKYVAEVLNKSTDQQINFISNKSTDQVELGTFNDIRKKELKKLVTHAPRNIYVEMIKWTEEGKLWHFPIDNEWKWDWEEKVEFTEHILLQQHLEPWCPTGGPIRHFMELVCVGLGKNPYITAEEKRQHIYWFRDYFEEKRKLLEEIGAFGSQQKKIEQAQES